MTRLQALRVQRLAGKEGGEEYMAKINPYLGFNGSAREAMEFYKAAFGGELTMTTFGEGAPGQGEPENNIMHAELTIRPEMSLMASDMSENNTPTDRMSVSLSGQADELEKLKGCWEKLSEGASVEVPMATAPWGDTFGMLTDKFGIKWMVNIAGKKE